MIKLKHQLKMFHFLNNCKTFFLLHRTTITVTYYTPFLQEVWEKKPEIEQAFHMEEPVTLDSGEGTLEHSTHHLPQPPPRHESYMLKNADGSGSENYEHLPTRSLNSLNGGDDNNINFNLNDNNEKYPHLYMLGEKDMGIDDSYLNDDDKDDKSRLIHQGNQPPIMAHYIRINFTFSIFNQIEKKTIKQKPTTFHNKITICMLIEYFF